MPTASEGRGPHTMLTICSRRCTTPAAQEVPGFTQPAGSALDAAMSVTGARPQDDSAAAAALDSGVSSDSTQQPCGLWYGHPLQHAADRAGGLCRAVQGE